MTTKTIVIVGENLLAKELFNSFQDNGLYQVFHITLQTIEDMMSSLKQQIST